MQVKTLNAGPGQQRSWNPISEYEVGRPRLRARKNPVPQSMGTNPLFPMPGSASFQSNASLQLIAWNLRDMDIILAGKTWNQQRILFTQGQNSAFTPFGGTSSYPKPLIQTNISSSTGLLPSPQSFLLSHLRTILTANIYEADFLRLLYSTYYQFLACDVNLPYFEGPGAVLPSAGTGPFSSGAATTAPGMMFSVGWPTAQNVASIRTGLFDPEIGAEDQGYNISENKQFKFTLDPTQLDFISTASTVAQGSWATTATASAGTGVQVAVELCGVLARSTAG